MGGPGRACPQRTSDGDTVVVQCPSCAEPVAVVGYPDPPGDAPDVPMPRCPWCGSHRLTPVDEEWLCGGCGKGHPTRAFKCARPTCWETAFLSRVCRRHEDGRPR